MGGVEGQRWRERTDRRSETDRQIGGQTDTYKDILTKRYIGKHIDGQTDGRTVRTGKRTLNLPHTVSQERFLYRDRQIDRQNGRKRARKRYRETDTHAGR